MTDISKLRKKLMSHYSEIYNSVLAEELTEANLDGFYRGREQGKLDAQQEIQSALGLNTKQQGEDQ